MAERIEAATRLHAEALAGNMRPEDAAEVRASHGAEPLAVILESVEESEEAHTLFLGGEVAAIFGIQRIDRGTGVAWALTSTVVDRHKVAFARASRAILASLLDTHPTLINFIDARYPAALRWAAWLGFRVGEPVAFGAAGLPFHPIAIRRRY